MLTRNWRAFTGLALVLAGGLTAACSDAGLTAPSEHEAADTHVMKTVRGELVLPMVRWNTPRTRSATVSQTVGVLGGTVSAGGVTLVIPPFALGRSTKITLTVPAGEYVSVDLQPHGLQFRGQPLLLFPVLGTELQVLDLLREVVGVYTEHTPVDGQILAAELFPVQVLGLSLGFKIAHFSEYAPARGGYVLLGD